MKEQFLYVDGQPVLSLAEAMRYAYAIPEDAVVPLLMTRWIAGDDLSTDQICACLRGAATDIASSSDEALWVVRLALERIARRCSQAEPNSNGIS